MQHDQYYNTNPINGGTRHQIPQYKRDSNSIGSGGFVAATATAPETVVPNDRGRTKYKFESTKEQQFKPLRRPLKPHRCGADPPRPEGKAYMPPPKLPEHVRAERTHSQQFNLRTTQENSLAAKMQSKTSVRDPSGLSVGRRPAAEAPIENYFQTKTRVSDYSMLRNGVKQATPGDKCYAAVEYSSGYFKQSGVIPGANVGTYGPKSGQGRHMFLPPPGFKKRQERRLGKKMREAGKAISATESVLTYERLSYEAKRNARLLAEEMDGVKDLTETDEDVFNALCAEHYRERHSGQILKKKDRERLYGTFAQPIGSGADVKEEQEEDDKPVDPYDQDSEDEEEAAGPGTPGLDDSHEFVTGGRGDLDSINVTQYGGYSAGLGDVDHKGAWISECALKASTFRAQAKGAHLKPSWEGRTGLHTWQSLQKKEPTPRGEEEDDI